MKMQNISQMHSFHKTLSFYLSCCRIEATKFFACIHFSHFQTTKFFPFQATKLFACMHFSHFHKSIKLSNYPTFQKQKNVLNMIQQCQQRLSLTLLPECSDAHDIILLRGHPSKWDVRLTIEQIVQKTALNMQKWTPQHKGYPWNCCHNSPIMPLWHHPSQRTSFQMGSK